MSGLDQTNIDLAKVDWDFYINGQAQIQDDKKNKLIRVQIIKIILEDVCMKILFGWAAVNSCPQNPSKGEWSKCYDDPDLNINLEIYESSDLNEGRISLDSKIMQRKIVLLRSDDPALLEKSLIKGLT